MKKILAVIKRVPSAIWSLFSHDLGWKLLSIALAIFLWFYVVSSNSNITRDKTITGVEVTTTGLTVLQSRTLALLTDPANELDDVRVRVRVSQSDYARVDLDTVRVEMDLSSIRQTGRQEIELTGVTNYGEVVQVTPSKVEVMVEPLDSRYVPVNVELTGDQQDNYWYSVSRYNPVQILVSGPSSVMQEVSSALVQFDITGLTASENRAAQFVLRNAMGETISQTLTKSSSSVMVNVDIYPTKQLPVLSDVDVVTTGTLAEGYRISHIEVQPELITVAAEQNLLDELDSLTLSPVNVQNRESSFATSAAINTIANVKNYSSTQVNVTVYIEEVDVTRRYTNVAITLKGLSEGLSAELNETSVTVDASGPHSEMAQIMRADLTASVDVSGLPAGVHDLPVTVSTEVYSDLRFVCTPATVRVTIK